MAKKNIKAAAETGANSAFDLITGGTQDTQDTKATKSAKDTKDTEGTQQYYRMNLKMPVEFKDYIYAQAYYQSNEKHTVSATEYLCNLIREDLERHNKRK